MLLERSEPWLHDIEISGLVRNESDAQVLREQGANAIVCSGFEDEGRLQAVAEEFDSKLCASVRACIFNVLIHRLVIIHAGGGGHIGAAVTLIKGLSARRTKLGNPVHYFHVTGASNISDRPQTQGYVETRTLSDREGIYHYLKYRESIEKWIQRTADIVIAETGQQLNVPTYIAMAPTIFGIGSGKFKRYTTQLPAMIKNMLDTGSCLVLGDGKTQWGRVHVEDIGTFLMCLCRNVLQGKKIPSGDQGIYFVETGRFTHREFSQRLADVGYKMGFVSSPTVTEASLDEVAKRFTNGNRLIAELSYGAK